MLPGYIILNISNTTLISFVVYIPYYHLYWQAVDQLPDHL